MPQNLFRFFIPGEAKEISTDSDLWKLLLLGDRARAAKHQMSDNAADHIDITIGDYFTAVRVFLSKNDFSVLRNGLGILLKTHINTKDICKLDLFLEKHGAFYHPVRLIAVLQDGTTCSFVINGAVSRQGLALIQDEYRMIKYLGAKYSSDHLPCVFGCDILEDGKKRFGFFIGQWLDGFKEFHITEINGEKKVVIWNSNGSCSYIHQKNAFPVYRDIAKILTLYYDLETFQQVFPWHQAAGDFIVRRHKDGFDTKLVTIRGYGDLMGFEFSDSDPGSDKAVFVLPSLMMFFLNLSLRVRLDRLDGTGEPVMVEKKVLPFVVDGFLAGLDQKSHQLNEPGLRDGFVEFFTQFSLDQLLEIMVNILEAHPPGPFEMELVRKKIIQHCRLIYTIFKSM